MATSFLYYSYSWSPNRLDCLRSTSVAYRVKIFGGCPIRTTLFSLFSATCPSSTPFNFEWQHSAETRPLSCGSGYDPFTLFTLVIDIRGYHGSGSAHCWGYQWRWWNTYNKSYQRDWRKLDSLRMDVLFDAFLHVQLHFLSFLLIDIPYLVVALLVSIPAAHLHCMFNSMESFRNANWLVKVSYHVDIYKPWLQENHI